MADELAHGVLRGDTLEDVLDLVARRTRELLGAQVAEIVVTDEGVPEDRQFDAGGRLDDGTVLGPVERDALGVDAPLVLAERDGRVLLGVAAPGPAVLAPLAEQGHVTGLLLAARAPGAAPFDDDDLFVAATLADEAARVVEYIAMRTARERVAALEERDRIATELHDGIVQSLFAVGLTAQSLRALDDLSEVRAGLAEAVQMVDATIRDLRAYIFGPAEQDHTLELGRVIRAVAAGFGPALRNLDVQLDEEAVAALAPCGPDVLQAVREALSNAARHAGARHVRLVISSVDSGSAVLVEVVDDGRGFDSEAVRRRGHGLANLAARAQRARATVTIDSRPGGGCHVRLRVPVGGSTDGSSGARQGQV